jgi:hypothetical protein
MSETHMVPPDQTDALDFRRLENDSFILFLHPDIRGLPDELWVDVAIQRRHVHAYWNGLAFVALFGGRRHVPELPGRGAQRWFSCGPDTPRLSAAYSG